MNCVSPPRSLVHVAVGTDQAMDHLYRSGVGPMLEPPTASIYGFVWWFPDIGVPPNHPNLRVIFHEINHLFWASPMTMETP